jgi:hypothetical protein
MKTIDIADEDVEVFRGILEIIDEAYLFTQGGTPEGRVMRYIFNQLKVPLALEDAIDYLNSEIKNERS